MKQPNPTRRRRITWIAVAAGLAVSLYLLCPVLLNFAARQLVRVDAQTPADLIVALGGDARCLREQRAFELYKQGLGKRIVVSGVPLAWRAHTGDAAKRYLISLGVREDEIIVLRESWNTRREAIDIAKIMKEHGWNSALIVTSPFHSRRALYTFNRYGQGLTFHSSPVAAEAPEWRPERWWSRRGDMGTTVREFLAWANTLAGGLQ